MRSINLIVIHCSDSFFGDAATIRRWHTDQPPKGNGWKDIGYHFVILNGWRKAGTFDPEADGVVEHGRPEEKIGSHARGYNKASLGVCLVGGQSWNGKTVMVSWPTDKQLAALFALLDDLTTRYPQARIVGHCELNSGKTCPNLNMDALRARYEAWKEEKTGLQKS